MNYITKAGNEIELHENWNGIYVGDYTNHINFCRVITYSVNESMYESAKYTEMQEVMREYGNSEVLCHTPKAQYNRRVKSLKKLGYEVLKDNYDYQESNYKDVYFVVRKAA